MASGVRTDVAPLFRLALRRVRMDVAPLFKLVVRRVQTGELLRSCGNGLDHFAK